MLKKLLSIMLSTGLIYTAVSMPLTASASTTASVEWQKTFGDNTYTECLSHTEQTADGGYISCGEYGNLMYITKLDKSGNMEWEQKPFDTSSSSTCVKQTSDGGYIVCGNVKPADATDWSTKYGHLIKLDCDGNVEWDQALSNAYEINDVIQDSDGNYLIVGMSQSSQRKGDIYIQKHDKDGNRISGYYYGGSKLEEGAKIRQTADGGYIVVGSTFSFVKSNCCCGIYLIKLTNSLSCTWSKTTSLGNSSYDYTPYDLECTNDGGYVISGNKDSKYGFLIKVSSSGYQQFERTYGADIFDVAQLDNGDFILVGDENVSGSYDYHTFVVNTNSTGSQLSSSTPESSSYSISEHVSSTDDGGYILTNKLKVGSACQLMKFGNIE